MSNVHSDGAGLCTPTRTQRKRSRPLLEEQVAAALADHAAAQASTGMQLAVDAGMASSGLCFAVPVVSNVSLLAIHKAVVYKMKTFVHMNFSEVSTTCASLYVSAMCAASCRPIGSFAWSIGMAMHTHRDRESGMQQQHHQIWLQCSAPSSTPSGSHAVAC